ncbi:MAG: GlmU family protein [Bacteroidota bacterium]
MNYIFFEDQTRENLLPFTFTRPVCEIRIGITTITEKWKHFLNGNFSFATQAYLAQKYPLQLQANSVFVNGSVFPNATLINEINQLKANQAIVFENTIIAYVSNEVVADFSKFEKITTASNPIQIKNVWDIFLKNGEAIQFDFEWLTKGRKSQAISSTNKVIAPENIFIEDGAVVECSILNASTGAIYIGKDAEVMEGSIIRGPFALCEHAATKLGTKIYGPTTIGPYSKVGGEVNNSVIFGFSNKGHDGFLGNSVLGEWCNLGADTNNSNLKNNYSEVKIYNYTKKDFVGTGLQFCGLFMGDHSKCGINTMFNTGTVVGVSSNIFGAGFPEKYIPSFSWGGAEASEVFKLDKAMELAERVFERRAKTFNETEKNIFKYLFNNK